MWTKAEERELKSLLRQRLTVKQIAEKLNKKPQVVCYKLKTIGISAASRAKKFGLIGIGNCKHKHLRKLAMEYYQNHTTEQCQEKFNLTPSEFKSLLTVSYKDPNLNHLRKDTRRNDIWSFEETMFLLKHAGIRPRRWIGKKLKRGDRYTVKEQVRRLNCNTRYINGLSHGKATLLLRENIEGIKTKAGPQSEVSDCRYVLVPWVILAREVRNKDHIPRHLKDAIKAMAKFQRRIHGTRGIKDTIESIKQCLRRR